MGKPILLTQAAHLGFTGPFHRRVPVGTLPTGPNLARYRAFAADGERFFQINPPMTEASPMFKVPFLAGIAAILATAALCSPAQAAEPRNPFNGRQTYSGSNMDCLVANDFYAVHFSALQEGRKAGETTDFVKYCQEIPGIGKVYLSIDLLDRDTRTTPIALSEVEEDNSAEGRPPETKSTLAETPAKIYRSGTADTHVDITKPGHYALIATIGDGPITEDDQLRIPFSVGLPPPTDYGKFAGRFTGAVVILFFGAMGVIGFRTWQTYRPKSVRPAEVPAEAGTSQAKAS